VMNVTSSSRERRSRFHLTLGPEHGLRHESTVLVLSSTSDMGKSLAASRLSRDSLIVQCSDWSGNGQSPGPSILLICRPKVPKKEVFLHFPTNYQLSGIVTSPECNSSQQQQVLPRTSARASVCTGMRLTMGDKAGPAHDVNMNITVHLLEILVPFL